MEKAIIAWDDFTKVDLRIGTIIQVIDFPEARKPAFKLIIDLGEMGHKKSSAQITALYTKEHLINKQVLCVCNFEPKQIGNWISEVLVTGFSNSDGDIVLSTIDSAAPNGSNLH